MKIKGWVVLDLRAEMIIDDVFDLSTKLVVKLSMLIGLGQSKNCFFVLLKTAAFAFTFKICTYTIHGIQSLF